jgi:Tol biopolymer transport system component
MTARGRSKRRAGAGSEPSWSPDSRRLAYVRTVGGRPAIVVQQLAGGSTTVVAHGTSPSWSPDGTLIAYLEGTTKVRIVSPNGTNDRLLLDGETFEDVNGVAWEHYTAPIAWAPQGNTLAVSATLLEQDGTGHGDSVRVAALSGSTSGTIPLFANSGLDWSPDGKTP